ncbi:nucleobase:cation symporter-2, NCS2 family [Franzmannia pantelleriensis]|uniref:Nucleobase:cation symporter-2, NCS2 family n=1 Tax=Franzmannia pantelleriensis TaxID=48727 RepID=A0A1G9IV61_9GAMM|nr:nucleobase:cation symporter-2 family protein [Halomonas pantelleriensis]SDL28966.1 nucleobase:cation symporter-2, NCS2 family [Halomonas pantelleriensis]
MSTPQHSQSVFDFHGRPPLDKALPLSLQHILAMIMGTVTVPIIVVGAVGGSHAEQMTLIQISLIASALSTLIQLYGIGKLGARLPTIFGVGFAYVPTLVAVGAQYGIGGILGAQIIGGVTMIVVGLFITRIRHLFPPVVAGTVVLVIGLSLYDIAVNYMAGGVGQNDYGDPLNWLIALATLLVVLVVSQFARGFLKLAAIICGIGVGYLLALALGRVDFSPVAEATWFTAPRVMPFELEFHAAAILSVVIICVVNSVQTIGDLSATSVGGMNREPTTRELFGGLMGNGATTALGSLFGAMPTSSYSQNVGIVAMTKVVSRYVLALAALFMLLAGLVPKFGAIMTTIPYPVLGGATITVFGMITMTGIQLITKDELSARNMTIVSLALALSMGIYAVPEAIEYFPSMLQLVLGGSPIVVAALVAFTLNLLLPKRSLADEAAEREAMAAKMNAEQQAGPDQTRAESRA